MRDPEVEVGVAQADCYLMKQALMISEDECGDTGYIHQSDGVCLFALVDGLGHGKPAHEAALLAEEYLAASTELDLVEMMQGLSDALRKSRGAVAALCRLNTETGEMRFCGIGNITTRIFSAEHTRITPGDGIVGYIMPTPKEKTFTLDHGDVVMLYSDGIKEHFDEYDCSGLLDGSAEDIVKKVFDCFYKGDDDGSCLVMRYA